MKKQIILIFIFIALIISGIGFFLYKNNEIKEKELIFEKNKECLTYKDNMYKLFLEEHDNINNPIKGIIGGIEMSSEIIDNKISKIYYNKKYNSCLFEVIYTESSRTSYKKENIDVYTYGDTIEVYDYFGSNKIIDFKLFCKVTNKDGKTISDEGKIPYCGNNSDFDKYEEWTKENNY